MRTDQSEPTIPEISYADRHRLDTVFGIVSEAIGSGAISLVSMVEYLDAVNTAYVRLLGNQQPAAEPPVPAVPIDESVFPNYIISLETGQKLQALRRHLSSRGMTPEDYRAKWKLPYDYPMVAANYSKKRSKLAKAMGLGTPAVPKVKPKAKGGKLRRVA